MIPHCIQHLAAVLSTFVRMWVIGTMLGYNMASCVRSFDILRLLMVMSP